MPPRETTKQTAHAEGSTWTVVQKKGIFARPTYVTLLDDEGRFCVACFEQKDLADRYREAVRRVIATIYDEGRVSYIYRTESASMVALLEEAARRGMSVIVYSFVEGGVVSRRIDPPSGGTK